MHFYAFLTLRRNIDKVTVVSIFNVPDMRIF